jgi:PhnB protein
VAEPGPVRRVVASDPDRNRITFFEHAGVNRAADPSAGRGSDALAPQLSVRRGRAAVEFCEEAFDAEEVYRVGGTDAHEAVVSQFAVGSSMFWVADESPPHLNFSPESLGGGTVRMLLTVADPDAAVQRAVAAGATEVTPVAEAHGWRIGRIVDPFGHHWEIGWPLVPWPPRGGRPRHHGQTSR